MVRKFLSPFLFCILFQVFYQTLSANFGPWAKLGNLETTLLYKGHFKAHLDQRSTVGDFLGRSRSRSRRLKNFVFFGRSRR